MEQNTNDANRDSPLYTSTCVFVVKYCHADSSSRERVPSSPSTAGLGAFERPSLKHLKDSSSVMEFRLPLSMFFSKRGLNLAQTV